MLRIRAGEFRLLRTPVKQNNAVTLGRLFFLLKEKMRLLHSHNFLTNSGDRRSPLHLKKRKYAYNVGAVFDRPFDFMKLLLTCNSPINYTI